MDKVAFEKHLRWAEAERLFPYKCSADKLTIGVGRNLDDRGITKDESAFLLNTDIENTLDECRRLDYWNNLDPVRQLIVADMVFNLGFARFKRFVKLNAALAIQDYSLAAHEMKDSRWYTQVGRRAEKLHTAMITGVWND
jgi:lysozyme